LLACTPTFGKVGVKKKIFHSRILFCTPHFKIRGATHAVDGLLFVHGLQTLCVFKRLVAHDVKYMFMLLEFMIVDVSDA